MSPFKGQGANQALIDATLLARVIYRAINKWNDDDASSISVRSKEEIHGLLPKALRWFEREMLERSQSKVLASHEASKFLHSPVALYHDNMTRALAYRNSIDK